MELRTWLKGLKTTLGISPRVRYDEIEERWIRPYLWDGTLKVDGGLGNRDKVEAIAERLKEKGLILVEVDLDEEELYSNRYRVKFAGMDFKLLKKFINHLEKHSTRQEYELHNITPDGKPGIYRMQIVFGDECIFEIYEGEWIPSFENQKIIAGFKL